MKCDKRMWVWDIDTFSYLIHMFIFGIIKISDKKMNYNFFKGLLPGYLGD
jgi:hypothetical protein